MTKGGLLITIKTPKKGSRHTKKPVEAFTPIMYEVQKTALQRIAKGVYENMMKEYMVAAIFFHRVVYRTPLDEEYKDENGRHHFPDEDKCRYCWFITDGKTLLTSKDLIDERYEVFDNFDDKDSLNYMFELFKKAFPFNKAGNLNLKIGNTCNHFDVLEYGGIFKAPNSTPIKKGDIYEHGVKNKRSVQAPVGMLRITRLELEDIRAGVKYDYRRYLEVDKIPSEFTLKHLIEKNNLKKIKVSFKDIKEIINDTYK